MHERKFVAKNRVVLSQENKQGSIFMQSDNYGGVLSCLADVCNGRGLLLEMPVDVLFGLGGRILEFNKSSVGIQKRHKQRKL